MNPPPRSGSRKASVYDCLRAHGAQAAMKLGIELGLAENTVKSWLGAWGSKGVQAPKRDEAPKSRVRERGFPATRKGTITARGPCISTVRWDNGDVRHVSNEYLIELK